MKSHFISGEWKSSQGQNFHSLNPATGEIIWNGTSATEKEINEAVLSAKKTFDSWYDLTLEKRIQHLKNYAKTVEEHKDEIAVAISEEAGKPLWESKTEAGALIAKVKITIESFKNRCSTTSRPAVGTAISYTRYKPHGVVAVFGPYNFPCHLANGHIVPALLSGNTVIFKPSELTPLTAELMIKMWEKSGLPKGVINLVQGGKETGQALSQHSEINGLFFTGSTKTGILLNKIFSEHPEKILALEMGGNNPLVVFDSKDITAAAYLVVQSAFLTAGQRCTCARRLIIPQNSFGENLLNELIKITKKIKVGHYKEEPTPFMGPVISNEAAKDLLNEFENLKGLGGKSLVEMNLLKENTGLITPGIIDVTNIQVEDKELFGPLLFVKRVDNFDQAIQEANNTRYGLSAGIVTDKKELYEKFLKYVNAGIVNWNNQLTGASSAAPFGGIGISGNHRPSAYFAVDYCNYPVASLEVEELTMPEKLAPGIDL